MKIKTRLQLNTLSSLFLAIIIGLLLIFNFKQLNTSIDKTRIANEIVKAVFELNLVTNEYILHHEERPKSQWLMKHSSIEQALNTNYFDRKSEIVFIKSLKKENKQMKDIFQKISEDDLKLLNENDNNIVRERLISLLLIQSENMVSDAFRLSELSHSQVIDDQKQFSTLILFFILIGPLLVLLNNIVFNRNVIKPIEVLGNEFETIGDNNFEHKSSINTDDEIGNLANSFNKMTERLKNTTVSRDMLLKEIDERRRIDRVRQEITEQLSNSNRELEQFAYIASHDLQEPLRMVSSYCKLLEKRYKDKLDEDAVEFISFAVEGANRMHNLLEALLSYSRVGTKKAEFTNVSSESILEATLQNLHESIVENNVIVNHASLPEIIADERQMIQLFQNLIFNSIRYKSDKDPEIYIDCKKEDDSWHFSFKDNGIGIDPEYANRIFIIFQRLHTRSEYSGMGIGLAICKKIVERHKGTIWVESELGDGATFHFKIPA